MTVFERMPVAEVDLRLPESERWAALARTHRSGAKALLRAIEDDLRGRGWTPRGLAAVAQATWAGYRLLGGQWTGEMRAWAEAGGIDPSRTCFANCSYELAQAAENLGWRWGSVLGCTAGMLDRAGGPVHVRTLDWPLPALGRHSLVVRFRDGRRRFLAVTAPGFVGVLTGMLPRAYGVSLNYAPPSEVPNPAAWGPSFLIRRVLEEIDDYAGAVEALATEPLSCPAFFVVSGAQPGQGVVIERTGRDASLRRLRAGGPPLVQANHHVSRRLRSCNAPFEAEDEAGASVAAFSAERAGAMGAGLAALPGRATLHDVASALDVSPVLNSDTCQQVLMHPASGTLLAWRRRRA